MRTLLLSIFLTAAVASGYQQAAEQQFPSKEKTSSPGAAKPATETKHKKKSKHKSATAKKPKSAVSTPPGE